MKRFLPNHSLALWRALQSLLVDELIFSPDKGLSFASNAIFQPFTMSGAIELIVDAEARHVAGSRCYLPVIADGSALTLSSDFQATAQSAEFVATSGTKNVFELVYDGSTFWYTILTGTLNGGGGSAGPSLVLQGIKLYRDANQNLNQGANTIAWDTVITNDWSGDLTVYDIGNTPDIVTAPATGWAYMQFSCFIDGVVNNGNLWKLDIVINEGTASEAKVAQARMPINDNIANPGTTVDTWAYVQQGDVIKAVLTKTETSARATQENLDPTTTFTFMQQVQA